MKLVMIKRKTLFLLNKYYIIILIALVLAVIGGGYYFILKNKVSEIQKVGLVDLQSKLSVLDSKEAILRKLEDLNNRYSQITEGQLNQLSSVILKESDIPFLVIEMKKFIKDNELVMTNIDIGALSGQNETSGEIDQSAIKQLNFSISVNGVESYFKLKDFLDNLSNKLPLLELTSIVYTPGTESYNLNLTTFYQ